MENTTSKQIFFVCLQATIASFLQIIINCIFCHMLFVTNYWFCQTKLKDEWWWHILKIFFLRKEDGISCLKTSFSHWAVTTIPLSPSLVKTKYILRIFVCGKLMKIKIIYPITKFTLNCIFHNFDKSLKMHMIIRNGEKVYFIY